MKDSCVNFTANEIHEDVHSILKGKCGISWMISMLLISLIQLLNDYVQWNLWPIAAKRGTEDKERMWNEMDQNMETLCIYSEGVKEEILSRGSSL